ncbi:MAG: hypothetical protein A3H97_14970 [Acidobacteria bacterium RIFCSPLOWO2_02_FULL_65_29]|nr:MAG: hypothetical protein A3H97_14970 [Acidobacteria bacterium RIFCSPLOWO2_02_FULL_65_29]
MIAAAVTACGSGVAPVEIRERAYRANNLGVALLEQFKYPEAEAAFREALTIDGSLAMARVNLSLALFYARDLQGAAREATEAARLLPSAPQPPYILGLIAYAENRTPDALRELERVRQIDSGDVGANISLGQMYLEAMQYPQAIEVLRRAFAAEPYNVTAAYNLGLALARGGQPDEGRQMLERAQTLRTIGYSVTYGTGYLEQGRYAEALASTGAEADLVDTAVPPTTFAPSALEPAAGRVSAIESPFGRRFTVTDLTPAGLRQIAEGLGGCVTLVDADDDGHLDVFSGSPGGQRLFRNDGRATWTDVTVAAGLGDAPVDAVAVGCVAGDYDNDGMEDLFVLRYGASSLYHNEGQGRFSDATARTGLVAYPFLPGAAAFVDVDHDGDLDLAVAGLADLAATRQRASNDALVFPNDFAPAPFRLLRNNGNGTFADITAAARVQTATRAVAIAATDFDNRRDVDLIVVNYAGPPVLFQNLRDGTFRDVAVDVGLAAAAGANEAIAAVTVGDVNKDDFPDVFFARAGAGAFALSDGRGRFTNAAMPDGARAARAAQFLDYDGDGLLDLLSWSADGPHVFRNVGQQSEGTERGPRWSDVSTRAMPGSVGGAAPPASARGLALADLNGDGRTDLVTGGSGSLSFWRNSGGDESGSTSRTSQRVALRGRVSNRRGVGAKIQLRAGSLSTRIETSASTPAVAPGDVVFGLGIRPGADTLRVLWPSGVLQAEAAAGVGGALPSTLRSPLMVEELDRKPSSCPFLFTWNGDRFEFITDFMGAGEMAYWEGPGKYNIPDPLEYVRIRGDQLRPIDGRLRIRVTNELEEALFADRIELLAIAHPRDIELYPNEGMTEPPKPFRLFGVAGGHAPRAVDEHGHDVTDRIEEVDRRYPDDFALKQFRGYAEQHSLTLDLGPREKAPVLLLTGWTDYAFSSDNVAAHQAGLSLAPPSLQVKDLAGGWRTAIADIGIPVGRPQTIPIDLAPFLRAGERQVRVVTNMRIYWDRVAVGAAVSVDPTTAMRFLPATAILRPRGFSAETRPGGGEPVSYDYDRVELESPWKVMAGRYTREGDVRELVTKTDDMFVIAKPGDELAIDFDASSLAALPDGWTRTFLLAADGYSKEMDINSGSPDTVEPLPFHAMTRYPYRAPERYPDTPEHERYRATYNTRAVVRTVPSIDSAGSR